MSKTKINPRIEQLEKDLIKTRAQETLILKELKPLKTKSKLPELKSQARLEEIAARWNWENLDNKWTILQGAYCRLSWVQDGAKLDDEQKDIVQDTLDIIEALQKDIKLK